MAPDEDRFRDQGGASTSNPPAAVRWLMSQVIRRRMSAPAVERRRKKSEKARTRAGTPHRVEYFHQVEDGYSHLAVQLLQPLLAQYDVELVCHLVTVAHDQNLPEPKLLLALSRTDSAKVAPHYGLAFPETTQETTPATTPATTRETTPETKRPESGAPDPERVKLAERILAAVSQDDFVTVAVAAGGAVWNGDTAALSALAEEYGSCDPATADAKIAQGTKRRSELGHYSGAMFHYGGEWYWGADRFHHLEMRLLDLGARKGDGRDLICPRPPIEAGPLKDNGSLTFEIYASLRSPYTSMIFDRAVQLAEETGVKMVIRPVLPMVMRGVPATRMKGMYIFSDTLREAKAIGLDWGNMYDPIGDPVRNAYSLYPWARERGKGTALLSSFLNAAFFDGVNTNNDRGMQIVVEAAGLPWEEARAIMGNRDWEDELERNRLAMYAFGLWGVPSFRLLDSEGETILALWGQDRLWLFAREIQRVLGEAQR